MSYQGNKVLTFAQCGFDPMLGGISCAGLASLIDPKHEANKLVEAECAQGCGTKFQCRQFFASLTSCEACREKADRADRLERAKTYWESICPPSYRDTDKNHPGFPKLQYENTKTFKGTESLLLYGESRAGKSRLAVLLLKRCLVYFNLHVGILWPEQLKAVKSARETLELIHLWGRYDVLLMDDALLTGAQDERITDWLKDLIDYRMRYNRHQIITSQVGSEDYKQQSEKFGKQTDTDKKRVDALLARVREVCRVVPFAKQQPGDTTAF